MHELPMDLSAVLRHAVTAGASDVHLKLGQPPVFRTDGGWLRDDSSRDPQQNLIVFVAARSCRSTRARASAVTSATT